MIRLLFLAYIITSSFVPLAEGQSATPNVSLPVATYTPQPVYRPEWAKQGLRGKGVVLVTIDSKTGTVTGVRMLQSTGNSLLDGAALDAYSKWRFKPGSVSQVKMPIEFTNRPGGQISAQAPKSSPASYYLLILIGIVVVVTTILKRIRRLNCALNTERRSKQRPCAPGEERVRIAAREDLDSGKVDCESGERCRVFDKPARAEVRPRSNGSSADGACIKSAH
jgi:TonB family protein